MRPHLVLEVSVGDGVLSEELREVGRCQRSPRSDDVAVFLILPFNILFLSPPAVSVVPRHSRTASLNRARHCGKVLGTSVIDMHLSVPHFEYEDSNKPSASAQTTWNSCAVCVLLFGGLQ